MNKHPDRKQLIGYILSVDSKEVIDIRNHLKECDKCRKEAASLDSILKKSENSGTAPSDQVFRKIQSFLDDQQSEKKPFEKKSIQRILLRPAAASLIIIALLFTYNYYKSSQDSENVSLTLSRQSGNILYKKNKISQKTIAINSGSVITDNYSSAAISFGSFFNVKITENTELIINSAKNKKNNNDNIYILTFNLKAGNIFAEWKDYKIRKFFTISTKHAQFEALGTSFILTGKDDLTKLAVINGRVRVTLPESGDTFIIKSGEGFINNRISKKIHINTEYELSKFNKLFNKSIYKSSKINEKSGLRENIKKKNKNEMIQYNDEQNKSIDNEKIKKMREERFEMQRENRKLQREMRKNFRSGKN